MLHLDVLCGSLYETRPFWLGVLFFSGAALLGCCLASQQKETVGWPCMYLMLLLQMPAMVITSLTQFDGHNKSVLTVVLLGVSKVDF